MRLAGALLAAALAWALPAQAQDQGPHGLATGEAEAWEAVGRLDIAGKGFCTATLIAPDLVLTTAHCLFDRDTGAPVDSARLAFHAGFRNGLSAASREVRRAMVHPAYRFEPAAGAAHSRDDIALVELAQPIRDPGVPPFETAAEVGPGAQVSVVSYAVGRSEIPALQDACDVLGRERGVFVLTCEVDFGSSGAPIFAVEGGVARIVSVVSAKGELAGRRVALGTSLTEPLAELRAAFEAAGASGLPPHVVASAAAGMGIGARLVSVDGVLNGAEALPR